MKDWPISRSKRRILDMKRGIPSLWLSNIEERLYSFSLIPCGLNLDKYTLNGETGNGNSKW
jgi:hypothetical protein